MTITLVQSIAWDGGGTSLGITSASGAGAPTGTRTFASTTTAGNLIVVAISAGQTAGNTDDVAPTVPDTANNNYTLVAVVQGVGGAAQPGAEYIFATLGGCTAQASNVFNPTFGSSQNFLSFNCYEFHDSNGAPDGWALDQIASATSASTVSASTVQVPSVAIGVTSNWTNQPTGVGAGWTIKTNPTPIFTASAHNILTSTGSFAPGFTPNTTSADAQVVIANIYPKGSATPARWLPIANTESEWFAIQKKAANWRPDTDNTVFINVSPLPAGAPTNTAFQPDAFQEDAFQIYGGTTGPPPVVIWLPVGGTEWQWQPPLRRPDSDNTVFVDNAPLPARQTVTWLPIANTELQWQAALSRPDSDNQTFVTPRRVIIGLPASSKELQWQQPIWRPDSDNTVFVPPRRIIVSLPTAGREHQWQPPLARSPDESAQWFVRSPNPVPTTWMPTTGQEDRPAAQRRPPDEPGTFFFTAQTAPITVSSLWWSSAFDGYIKPVSRSPDEAFPWFAKSPVPVPATWLPTTGEEDRPANPNRTRSPDEALTWFVAPASAQIAIWLPTGGQEDRPVNRLRAPDEAIPWFSPPAPFTWLPTTGQEDRPFALRPDIAAQPFIKQPAPVVGISGMAWWRPIEVYVGPPPPQLDYAISWDPQFIVQIVPPPVVNLAMFTVSGSDVSCHFAEFFTDVVFTDAPITKRTN